MFRHLLLPLVLLLGGCGILPRGERLPPGHAWPGDLSRVAQASGPAQVPVAVTRDGRLILTTDDQHAGLYLTDTRTSTTLTLNREWNAGYYAAFSPDGKQVFHKAFRPRGEGYDQAAIAHDIASGTAENLTGWVRQAGTPAATPDGMMGWAADGVLHLRSSRGAESHMRDDNIAVPIRTHAIGCTPNVIEFAPEGMRVAYPNADEQIEVLNLLTGERHVVTDGRLAYWGPKFSHFGNRMIARTINGKLVGIDLSTGAHTMLGSGEDPEWLDNDRFLFVEWEGGVRAASFADGPASIQRIGTIGIRWWALNGTAIASQKGPNIWLHRVEGNSLRDVAGFLRTPQGDPPPTVHTRWPRDMRDDGTTATKRLAETADTREIAGVPYIHQMFDLPDECPGQWACNATSALMLLAHHRVIPPRPIAVSRPGPHTSNYGDYVTNPHSAGGVEFDIASPGPDGKPVRGAYGYIVREDWKDTKHYMRDYLRLHGLESETDWQPTMAKLRAEIDTMRPLVVLHSVTFSGHYAVGIGYERHGLQVLVTNDPYGNKNTREYPSLDGRRARYDFPGSNNGYQNLRIVHCYITARKPAAP